MGGVTLNASVGLKQKNNKWDVIPVQFLLNKFIMPGGLPGTDPLVVDGDCGKLTKGAILQFQMIYVGVPTGVVQSPSPTLTKLNGPLPSHLTKRPSAKPPKPKKGSPADKKIDIDAYIEQFGRKVELTAADKKFIRSALSTYSDVTGTIDVITNAIDIVHAVRGTTAGISQIGTFSGILGFFGPFLQFAGFVAALDEAMDTHLKLYSAIAASFYITAWANNRTFPYRYATYEARIRKSPDITYSWRAMQDAWERGEIVGIKGKNEMVRRATTETGQGKSEAEKALKFLFRRFEPDDLVKRLCRSMKPAFGNRGPFGLLPPSMSPGEVIFFDHTIDGLRFPK